MDNFDLRKFLAEGKLHEAMSPQDVVDIADTVAEEFTIESAEEGDFLVYSVGKMEADNMSFELDTDLTSQSPKDIDTRGVGEGWGGIFRIKPTADGYEVRNAEKGGLVAMIDAMGNFKMLSADESRAEMGLEEDVDMAAVQSDENEAMDQVDETKEETKSNKMKKSELKEMIKSAFLGETEFGDALRKRAEEESFDDAFDRIDKEPDTYPGEKTLDPDYVKEAKDVDMIPAEKLFALIARDLEFSPLAQDNVMLSKEDAIEIMRHVIAIEQSDISPEAALGEYIARGEFEEAGDIPGFEGTKDALDKLGLEEAEEDEEVEVDADVNVDVDAEADAEEGGEEVDVEASEEEEIDVKEKAKVNPNVKAVQDALTIAQTAAAELGDDKLTDQIGNTITFFTRAHVASVDKEAMAEELNVNEVAFPMWTKINK